MSRFDNIKGEKAAIRYNDALKFMNIVSIVDNHIELYFIDCCDKEYNNFIKSLDSSFIEVSNFTHINIKICKKYKISCEENIIEKNSHIVVLYTDDFLRVININVGSELQALIFCSTLEEYDLIKYEEDELIGY